MPFVSDLLLFQWSLLRLGALLGWFPRKAKRNPYHFGGNERREKTGMNEME